ncbi:MAG TPA: Grx4 family monothiol glutaredoxin [Gammaproteobacteria bacterium]|nr:Grx4 family monothiol glutaredoxin [Gammaproteobacteria bacterium]
MDIQERIRKQLEENPVIIYMKGSPDFPQCGFSARATAALKACGKPFAYVDVLQDQEVREGIKQYGNWPTIPQLYVKGELIGGSDIIVEMYEKGELKELLESAAQ